MAVRGKFLACLFLVSFVGLSLAKDYSFTFKVPSGQQECFYEHVKEGTSLEIEYQVVEGGELDINFSLHGPNHEIISDEQHKMDGLHSHDVTTAGEYGFCFDNTFSHMSHKTIFMDVIMDNDNEEEEDLGEITMSPDTIVHDMKVLDIRKILHNVTDHLNKVEVLQQFFRAREARHRYTLESNNNRVQWWSLVYCVLIIGVGMTQVFVLRRLFRNQRKDKITT